MEAATAAHDRFQLPTLPSPTQTQYISTSRHGPTSTNHRRYYACRNPVRESLDFLRAPNVNSCQTTLPSPPFGLSSLSSSSSPPPPHILTFTPSERTRQSQLPLPPLTLLFADLDPSIPIRATTSDPANPTSSTSPRTHSLKIGWRRRANRLQVLASALLQETQARLLPSSQPHIAARPTPMLTTLFCLQPIQTR